MKFFFLILFLSILTQSAWSQEQYERVTVYGTKQDHFQISHPLSSTLDQKIMEQRHIFSAEDLWSEFSNLNTSSSTNRIRYIKIRGVGERSEYDTIPSNSVGVFYDHIDLSGLSSVLATYDVQKVEVLKGPQTFLYGDASLGGNIVFTSKDASLENEHEVWLGAGSQKRATLGSRHVWLIGENSAVKAGLQAHQSDGFFYNEYHSRPTSSRKEVFAHVGLETSWKKNHFKATSLFGNQNNGNDFWNTDGSYNTQSDRPGEDDQKTVGQSFEVSGHLNPKLKYLALASYSYSDLINSYDEDWNNNSHWNEVAGWNKNYDYFKFYHRKKYNTHSKFILQSPLSSSTLLSYGLHAYQKREKSFIQSFKNNLLRNQLDSLFVSNKLAGLISLQHYFNPSFLLEFNQRYEKQWIDYEDTNSFSQDLRNDMYAFQLHLQKQLKRHQISFLISRGFKGAGFNPEVNLKPEQQHYDPEHAMNYEISWLYKGSWQSHKVSTFYFDRRDHQITTSSQDDPSDPSNYTFFIDNAAKSHTYGLELSSQFKVTNRLSLDLSYGFLRAEFKDYSLEGVSYAGRDLAHSPRHTYSANLNWKIFKTLDFNFGLSGMDEFNFSNSHLQKSEPYTIFNSSLSYKVGPQTQIKLWARNLFDKQYSKRGFYFGNEPPNWESTLYTHNAPPLEWGLRLHHDF